MKAKTNTTYVPFVLRVGAPILLPLWGPASATREDAQQRLDEALAKPIFTDGEIREVDSKGRVKTN